MNCAIGSKVALDDDENFYAMEFQDCISDLLDLPEVQALDDFSQHLNTSRLQHSLNVSYYSYLMCKFFNFDFKSAARAGLLHDLFLYDWRNERQPEGAHAFAHPKIALRNAKKISNLNEIEADAIVKHMFPVTIQLPKYKESYIVSLADKYSATLEIVLQLKSKFSFRLRLRFNK